MANSYTPPEITIEELDYRHPCGPAFVLMAHSHAHTAIAGTRLFRAEPWPEIRWTSPTKESAEAEAVKLRAYLAECASGKRKQKEHEPRRRGWWED